MKYKLAVMIPTYNQPLLQRAVDSVPLRNDVLVVVCDDGSAPVSDGSLALRRHSENLKKRDKLIVLNNAVNRGPGVAMNTILDYLTDIEVEYLVRLDSDDYFLPGLSGVIDNDLTGEDMIFYDLEINSGSKISLSEGNRHIACGAVKFWRKDFVGSTRYPAKYFGEDWFFNEDLLKKEHTEKYLGRAVVHYNFPRKGSLSDRKSVHG